MQSPTPSTATELVKPAVSSLGARCSCVLLLLLLLPLLLLLDLLVIHNAPPGLPPSPLRPCR